MKTITFLIPIHNEEKNIPLVYEKTSGISEKYKSYHFEWLFIDDGSTDKSSEVLSKLAYSNKDVKVLEFTRNFGKEIALTAGVHHINSDAVIIMDADLQHPPDKIPDFIKQWEEDHDIVLGKRKKIENRSPVKKLGSYFFYKIINRISDTEMKPGTTDFMLIDNKVLSSLKSFTERNRIFRGLVDWIGFNKTYVEFEAPDRLYGSEQYSMKKLIQLAINSFTSFSLFPLKITGYFGIFISSFSGLLLLYMLADKFILNLNNFRPIAYVAVSNVFLIGVVMIALGLIALYIGNIHVEVVNRPIYIVKNKRNFED